MDDTHVEDVDTDQEDHCYDDVRYACMSRPWAKSGEEKRKPKVKDYNFDEREEESWKTI